MGVSVYWPQSVLCMFVCFVCVISNQNTSKKPHYVSDLSKLEAFLHKTHIKVFLVPRLDMCRSKLSLSENAH